LFTSEEAQKAFLGDPDRYSPVLAGNDPVMRLDHNRDVPGKREHGAFYNDRIYLFASEETFLRFDRDPARYTVESRQAMRR
jgi:YHS domain-containing protein